MVLLVLVAAACSESEAAAPPPPSTTSTSTTVVDPDHVYAVGRRSETFVDTTRQTNASGGAPALPQRTIPTLVLYPSEGEPTDAPVDGATPSADGPFPLLVFSHGFTATGPRYEPLLQDLAAAGYVVAAPTFPLSSGGRATPPELADFANQPADVSFVLDEVVALLPDLVDPEHVAAGGHSLGAITTLGLAFDPCCTDPRIDAYVPISGIELPFPGDGGFDFTGRRPPVLLIHGDDDGTVPYTGSTQVYERSQGPRALVTLLDGPHTPFLDPYDPVIKASIVDFLDYALRGDDAALERLAEDADVPGVATLQQAGF